jgi:hypothetical protein
MDRRTTPSNVGEKKRNNQTGTPGKRKNLMSDAARKAFLQQDKWAREVKPWSITCNGCCKVIKLDGRNGVFYGSLWLKHRNLCGAIKRLEGNARQTTKVHAKVRAKLAGY